MNTHSRKVSLKKSSYSYKAFKNFIERRFRMLSMRMQNVSKPIWYFNEIKGEGNILVRKF